MKWVYYNHKKVSMTLFLVTITLVITETVREILTSSGQGLSVIMALSHLLLISVVFYLFRANGQVHNELWFRKYVFTFTLFLWLIIYDTLFIVNFVKPCMDAPFLLLISIGALYFGVPFIAAAYLMTFAVEMSGMIFHRFQKKKFI